MKKILSIIGVLGIVTTGISSTVAMAPKNYQLKSSINNEDIYIDTLNDNTIDTFNSANRWDNIGVNHSVSVQATGTHENYDVKSSAYSSSIFDFENVISNCQIVEVFGNFDLHTYINPRPLNSITFKKNESKSSKNKVIFEAYEKQDQWRGWGHQTSTITTSLTATYNYSEKITTLNLTSTLYIRTAGSVHAPYTSADYSYALFLI